MVFARRCRAFLFVMLAFLGLIYLGIYQLGSDTRQHVFVLENITITNITTTVPVVTTGFVDEPVAFPKTVQILRPHPDNKEVLSDWLVLGPKEYRNYLRKICDWEEAWRRRWRENNKTFCACFPVALVGAKLPPVSGEITKKTWAHVNASIISRDFKLGGLWRPRDCVARRRVAIIVPCRDRESHLKAFIARNVPIWQRQQIEFRVFVVEQAEPAVFNKGSVMNAGFLESSKLYKFDCVLFHDVDMLILNDQNIAHCSERMLHYGAFVSTLHYRLLYFSQSGGAVSMTPAHFRSLNGYSTRFAGWGGEDDEFFRRNQAAGYGWVRPDASISRFHMIKHTRDKQNPQNANASVAFDPRIFQNYMLDGLNTVVYRVKNIELTTFFTRITVDVAGHDGVYQPGPGDYDVINGTCGIETHIKNPGYSISSCKYICDQIARCDGFEYSLSERMCEVGALCKEPKPSNYSQVFYKREKRLTENS